MLAGMESSGQKRCDIIQAEFRRDTGERRSIRRDAPPVALALVPTEDILMLRLAEELDYARRMLVLMGDELCADAAIVVRHPRALQSIDIAGQMIGHIASVIRSSDPTGAVDRIGMAEMKARITRRRGL